MIGVVFLLLLGLQMGSSAADKTFFIDGDNIKKLNTDLVNADSSLIKFTKGGNPLPLYLPGTTTVITDFGITNGSVDDNNLPSGRNVQVDCVVGNVLSATIWQGTVGYGGYYGTTTLTMNQANFNDSALTWNWNNFNLAYKAAEPYKPKITQVQETSTFKYDGSPTVSTVTVNSAAGSDSDGLRPANAYAWKMWAPADPGNPGADVPAAPKAGATSANLSVPAQEVTAGVTYAFTVQYKNSWGDSEWSDIKTHTVAGGGGQCMPVTYNFQPGLNDFAVFALPVALDIVDSENNIVTITDINTAADFVNAINSVYPGAATTIGWLTNGQIVGYYVSEGAFTATEGADIAADGSENLAIKPYQISVTEGMTVTVK